MQVFLEALAIFQEPKCKAFDPGVQVNVVLVALAARLSLLNCLKTGG